MNYFRINSTTKLSRQTTAQPTNKLKTTYKTNSRSQKFSGEFAAVSRSSGKRQKKCRSTPVHLHSPRRAVRRPSVFR